MKVIIHDQIINLQYAYSIGKLELEVDTFDKEWFSYDYSFTISFLNGEDETFRWNLTEEEIEDKTLISETKEKFKKFVEEEYNKLIALWANVDPIGLPRINGEFKQNNKYHE